MGVCVFSTVLPADGAVQRLKASEASSCPTAILHLLVQFNALLASLQVKKEPNGTPPSAAAGTIGWSAPAPLVGR